MAYSRTTWANGSGGGTPLSAANLNNMEVELVALDTAVFYDPVTSLPGSPVDKQRAMLVDSLTAPTYAWMFQYESGISDSNKWVFVGGSPASHEIDTSQALTSATYADLSTVGPTLTIARAGVYEVEFGALIYASTPNSTTPTYVAVKIGAAATADADAVKAATTLFNDTWEGSVARKRRFTVAASDVVKLQYKTGTATSINIANRFLKITPVRVA